MDLKSLMGMFGGLSQGDKSSASVTPISSGIQGPTGFTSGDFIVNKTDQTGLYVIAGAAVLVVMVLFLRKK